MAKLINLLVFKDCKISLPESSSASEMQCCDVVNILKTTKTIMHICEAVQKYVIAPLPPSLPHYLYMLSMTAFLPN